MKRLLLGITLMVLLAVGLAACTMPETVVVEREADCGDTERYIVSAPLVHPYITAWQGGAEAAAEELGVEIVFLAPAEYSPEKQLEMTESALSLPCITGLSVMTGVPDIMEGILSQAKERGLGTTQNASCSEAVNADVCMATDFYTAGATVAERLVDLMGGEGNVVVAFGEPGNVVDKDRQAGLEDYFAEHAPDIKVIGVLIDCDNPEGTVRCAEEALVIYPEMDAYYSLAEIHFVHKKRGDTSGDQGDSYAVVGVMAVADDDAEISGVWSALSVQDVQGHGKNVSTAVRYSDLLPSDLSYYFYEGSLTTPTCDELVQWFLLRETISIPKSYLEELRKVEKDVAGDYLTYNYRNTQDLKGREVALHGGSEGLRPLLPVTLLLLVVIFML